MYYAYIFSCNSFVPFLLMASSSRQTIITELTTRVGGTLFDMDMIVKALEKNPELTGDANILYMAAFGDVLEGPAKEFDNGKDWYITKVAAMKLCNSQDDHTCNIPFMLSIFDLQGMDPINFEEITDVIAEYTI
jgi:hypothetical protein